jgi:uroporphyrinogen III methyltransferase/synthase
MKTRRPATGIRLRRPNSSGAPAGQGRQTRTPTRFAFQVQPLVGKTVLVTRPRGSGQRLPRELRRHGARVVWQPTVHIDEHLPTPELDAALDRLDEFDWIVFTSPRGVAAFWRRLIARGLDRSHLHHTAIAVVGPGAGGDKPSGLSIAAVGPGTAQALAERGIKASVIGQPYSAAGLLSVLTPMVRAASPTILYPRAASVSPTLVNGLREVGATVVETVAYRTEPLRSSGPLRKSLNGQVDCVVFCSPSAISAALPLRSHINGCTVACIGPVTAEAARAAGFTVSIVPEETTVPALALAIVQHFGKASR